MKKIIILMACHLAFLACEEDDFYDSFDGGEIDSTAITDPGQVKLIGQLIEVPKCVEVDNCGLEAVAGAEICTGVLDGQVCDTTDTDGTFAISGERRDPLQIPSASLENTQRFLLLSMQTDSKEGGLAVDEMELSKDNLSFFFDREIVEDKINVSNIRLVGHRKGNQIEELEVGGKVSIGEAGDSLHIGLTRLPTADETWTVYSSKNTSCDECEPEQIELGRLVGLEAVSLGEDRVTLLFPGLYFPIAGNSRAKATMVETASIQRFDSVTGLEGVSITAIEESVIPEQHAAPINPAIGAAEIAATYADTGGFWFSPLGWPSSAVLPTPDGLGMFQLYWFGGIYWTPTTGAHAVNGAIWDKWSSMGYETSFLGYPLINGTVTPDGNGVFSHFQGGSIYWSPATGAQEIHGAIRDKWESLGWEQGFLGYPTSDHLPTPDGIGAFSHFQGGSIYWSPTTGPHEIRGPIYDKWEALGWEQGLLGYPTSDQLVAPDTVGRYSKFQGGSIYWSPTTGAHEVHGAIFDRWANLGWEQGSLGYPTSDELPYGSAGRVSHFQGGSLYWSACSGVTETPPNCGGGGNTGGCKTDIDCTVGTCNNPWYNAYGTCVDYKVSYPHEAKGRIEYNNGDEHNSCTTNAVVNTMHAMGEYATTLVSYGGQEEKRLPPDMSRVPDLAPAYVELGLDPDEYCFGGLASGTPIFCLDVGFKGDHIQSIARIPGVGEERWMAATISNSDGSSPSSGGIYFLELGQLNGNDGEPFEAGQRDNRKQNINKAYFSVDTHHPGGMQIIGRTLATAAELDYITDEAMVYLYDVTNPAGTSASDALIDKIPLESRFYPEGVSAPNHASAVAIVRLHSGGYLMAVNKSSTKNPAKIWLFLTDYQSIRNGKARWYFHNYLEVNAPQGVENMTFVTQCDGIVHLMLTSNPNGGSPFNSENGVTNIVSAYKLVKSGHKLSLSFVDGRGAFRNGDYADFRSAATFYVSPQGEMVLYSNARSLFTEDGNYQMAEFVDPSFCGFGC
ncbi:MAG: hypothetical protein GY847_09835 [Proteobacteria bacterium]|nr:hypothetical protein [Pseudomonadota bacterium]